MTFKDELTGSVVKTFEFEGWAKAEIGSLPTHSV
jgi:hypothetical protein